MKKNDKMRHFWQNKQKKERKCRSIVMWSDWSSRRAKAKNLRVELERLKFPGSPYWICDEKEESYEMCRPQYENQ